MTSAEIRNTFIDFFKEKNHSVVNSSPVIPLGDPTLLFTNAGMNQFKNLFVGIDKRPYTRATSCQKCIRAGGKHNDLDNVGKTPRHHTFFEMLGNFSFGDYFKEDAIAFAHELLINKFNMPKEHLWISVYEKDDEATKIWQKYFPENRIVKLGKKDNFWEMGETGPCGPCTEIHIDMRSFFGECNPQNLAFDDEQCLELWNLVFMQFNRSDDGSLEPLPKPSVDTGAGLERITSILQGKHSNYETDLFTPLIDKVTELSSVPYTPLLCYGKKIMSDEEIEAGMPHRVIADHIRTLAFAIADGAVPSNEGRGYVLRRILRRASRYGRAIGIDKPFLTKLLPVLSKILGETYPQIVERQDYLTEMIEIEEKRFVTTLATGIELFNKIIEKNPSNIKLISGDDAFKLYDTYGFPLDITLDMAREHGWSVDIDGFNSALTKQREKAKSARSVAGPKLSKIYNELYEQFGDTTFLGYAQMRADSIILSMLNYNGEPCEELHEGEEGWIIVDQTPFYGESGGQVGDTGKMYSNNADADVLDVQRPINNLFSHHVKINKGVFHSLDIAVLQTSEEERQATMRHHTAAHLFHAALRQVIGKHATQAGSAVNHNRMRFDFHHHTALVSGEIEQIERIVNKIIISDLPVEITEMSLEEAQKTGATMLFNEKYGDIVRLVKIADFSSELCGGTHAPTTGCIGSFRIISESAVAAGIRRVEAVCGMEAFEEMLRSRRLIYESARILNVKEDDVPNRIEKIIADNKIISKKLKNAKSGNIGDYLSKTLTNLKVINNTNVIVANVGEIDAASLRSIADGIRAKLDDYVIVLGGINEGKCLFVAQISNDNIKKGLHAGNIIKQIAKIVGGGGGGKPETAQAGGKNPDKLDDALTEAKNIIEKM
ncbi:MAG: alanine--tRNA ligase [Chlamydiae bacterium]|nr:MAG: alanine--tRNA ligase [Chlamydiota bacterium]